MRLDLDEQGGWLVAPAELAHRLGMSEWALRRQAGLGRIDSRLERGYGRDAGRSRVTVIVGKCGWRGIFRADGCLISEFRWEPQLSAAAKQRCRPSRAV